MHGKDDPARTRSDLRHREPRVAVQADGGVEGAVHLHDTVWAVARPLVQAVEVLP
jgi:hypothetical protein